MLSIPAGFNRIPAYKAQEIFEKDPSIAHKRYYYFISHGAKQLSFNRISSLLRTDTGAILLMYFSGFAEVVEPDRDLHWVEPVTGFIWPDEAGKVITVIRQEFVKVAEVSFEGRQEKIAALNGTEKVEIRPEPDNAYDPRAHAVYAGGQHIGYIPKVEVARLWDLLTESPVIEASIWELSGGTEDFPTRGVKLHLQFHVKETAENVIATANNIMQEAAHQKNQGILESLDDNDPTADFDGDD